MFSQFFFLRLNLLSFLLINSNLFLSFVTEYADFFFHAWGGSIEFWIRPDFYGIIKSHKIDEFFFFHFDQDSISIKKTIANTKNILQEMENPTSPLRRHTSACNQCNRQNAFSVRRYKHTKSFIQTIFRLLCEIDTM